MPAYVCPGCLRVAAFPLPPARCPACRCPAPLRRVREAARHKPPVAVTDIPDEPVRWLPTPWSDLTDALGGGFARGCLYLLAGGPGLGKSRVALHFLAALPTAAKGLYLSAEMNLAKTARDARTVGAARTTLQIAEVNTVEMTLQRLREGKPDFAVVDSLAALRWERIPRSFPPGYDDVSLTAWTLKEWTNDHKDAVVLAIHHSNKQGGMHGSRHIEHEASGGVLLLEGDARQRTEPRCLAVGKNREGPGGELWLRMTQKGEDVPAGRLVPCKAPK